MASFVLFTGNIEKHALDSNDVSNEKARTREVRGLVNAAKKLKCKNLTLVTFETNETIEAEGYTIKAIAATEWLLMQSVL
jgi:hypothetical protein